MRRISVGTVSYTHLVITFDAGKVVTKDEKATKYATVLGSGSFGTNSGVTTPNTPVKVDPNRNHRRIRH